MWDKSGTINLSRGGIPPGVRWLLIVTVVAFVLQKLIGFRTDDIIEENLGLSYNGLFLHGHLWQLVTYMFLHGDFLHIFMNMLLLFIFGRELEPVLKTERFLWLYVGCGVLAGLGWIIISGSREGDAMCIGASGAAFGVAAAFAALNPRRELTLIIFPIPIPVTMRALTMILIFGSVSMLGLLLFQEGRIAHAAHLAGGVAGYVYGHRARRPERKNVNRRTSPRTNAAWPEDEELNFLEEGQDPETMDRREIDRILEKIQDKGMQSLTRRERKYLEDASRLDDT
jgi:membrane associated rhomboid family serine protease